MSMGLTSPILWQIRRMVHDEGTKRRSDQDLLAAFANRRDEAAFHALVHRHGPMVLDVCRCVLANEADAEDAFQAAFLILARKAGSIRKAGALGSWLYGVAYRTALHAQRERARRRKHECHAPPRDAPVTDDLSWRDALRVVHEEVNRLAPRHQAPLVLCYLQGRTQDEAAAHLGIPKGTLKTRLEQGRALLRKRLVRRGLGPAALLVASAWPGATQAAGVPVALAGTTVKAGLLGAAGQAAGTELVSLKVAALAEGMCKAMVMNKLKAVGTLVLLLGFLVTGATVLPSPLSPAGERGGGEGAAASLPPARANPEPAKPVVVRQDANLQRMAMSPDGEVVATVGVAHDGSTFNSTVKLWDVRTGELKQALDEEKDSHLGIAFSRDFLAINVHGKRREVRLVNAKTLALKQAIDETHVPDVRSWGPLAFSPDGKRLAVAGTALAGANRESAPFLKLWDGEKQRFIEGNPELGAIPRGVVIDPINVTNGVGSLAFSPDGKLLATAWVDGNIRLYDGRTGEFRTLLGPELGAVEAGCGPIAFSHDSKTLASKGKDNTVILWDLEKGKPGRTLKGHHGDVDAIAFSKDGRWIATGGRSAKKGEYYEVILRDAKSGGVQQTFSDLTEWVHAIAFSADSKTLVFCGGGHRPEGNERYKSSGEIRFLPLE